MKPKEKTCCKCNKKIIAGNKLVVTDTVTFTKGKYVHNINSYHENCYNIYTAPDLSPYINLADYTPTE